MSRVDILPGRIGVSLGTYGELNDMILINESDAAGELISWLRRVGVAR